MFISERSQPHSLHYSLFVIHYSLPNMTYMSDIASSMESFFEENKREILYEGRSIEAVPAGTQWHDIEPVKGQLKMLSSSRDYICLQSDFPSGSEPAAKDKITDAGEVWTVYRLDGGETFRKIPYTNLIRIHCKK